MFYPNKMPKLPHISIEDEVQNKPVTEMELKESIENEHRINEKAPYKIRVTLIDSKPEEADCLVTEDYLVIETEEPIKIPFLQLFLRLK